MTEHNHSEQIEQPLQAGSAGEVETAYGYLSNALRISFVVLKIIMAVLVVSFLASGFQTINPDERALVLRFGKIRGTGEERLLGPGLKWVWPYPIDLVIRIPVEKKTNLAVDDFWYYTRPDEQIPEGPDQRYRIPPVLDPLIEGYSIVRGEKEEEAAGAAGSDYNILHSKWELTYQITDPERFFKNTFVDAEHLQAGQNYTQMIDKSISPLLRNLLCGAVTNAMVHYTIEDAISERRAGVTEHVRKNLQYKLDQTDSGIKVVSVQLKDTIWPRQVDGAFQAAHTATAAREKAINDAKLYAEKTLSETGGQVAYRLIEALRAGQADAEQTQRLWDELAGRAQAVIAGAKTYRTQVVEGAKADAEYLQKILPEYRKRPQLVLQRIYKDNIEQILEKVDEKTIIETGQSKGRRETRILINRDTALKPKQQEQKQ